MNGTTTVQLAEKTAKAVTDSVEEWTGFLQSAARLYKYSYPEQLLIYAQRPDATACASYEIWNQTMRRYVRRGARGIALPDGAGAVRYVFDVADTGARKSSREVKTWALDENNREAVAHALETQYGSAAKLGIAGQLEEIAMQQSMDYWQWHQDELRGIVDGSFLEGYDELNLEIAFRNTAAASVKYMLLSRCNLAREYQIEPEELAGVLEWNTSAASGALGSAVSELSEGYSDRLKEPSVNMKGAKTMTNELTYTKNGEYWIPDLTAAEQSVTLSKYGRMREWFLKKHRTITYNNLLLSGKLTAHLMEIDQAAVNRMEEIVPKLAKQAGATEALKASDPMRWVGLMNTCKAQAEEIVMNELIYA